MIARLCAVRIGQPRVVCDSTPWVTAFFKEPVEGRVQVLKTHLYGDRQADLDVHGGPDKAVCVYSADHYAAWRQELDVRECGPGWFGENFSVENQSEETVCVGDVYRIGSAILEVSQPRGPCWKLAKRWGRPEMPKLVVRSGRSGWYLRVLEEGFVSRGDESTLMARPHPRWTIAIVNDLMYARAPRTKEIADSRRALAQCTALAGSWRRGLDGGRA